MPTLTKPPQGKNISLRARTYWLCQFNIGEIHSPDRQPWRKEIDSTLFQEHKGEPSWVFLQSLSIQYKDYTIASLNMLWCGCHSLLKVIPEDCQEDHDENKHLCQFPATTNSSIDFLSKHSESNHNDYCLSFIFTNNQFHDGSLGLAYQAHPLRGEYFCYFIYQKSPIH